MLTEIISKTVADKTVDSILKRIERAVPVPEPGDGGFDAAMRQAFNMGAACMAAQIKNGPVPTKRIALMGRGGPRGVPRPPGGHGVPAWS